MLVKVTLPARTGRKRKRGSDEPFAGPAEPKLNESITAPELLERMRENEGRYDVTPVAMLRETHRFRALPDFQIRNSELPIMRELRDHAMRPDYYRLKDFHVDPSSTIPYSTAFPGPPSFTSIDIPHKYEYQQASSVIYLPDESGNITTKNVAAPPKRHTWGLPPDIDQVPQQAPFDIPKRSPSGEMLPRAIKELKKLLEERPLVTKRVALNALPPISDSIFKEATQFVGYSFKAGPWRDSLIRYGVDPRKDPKYRFYQTLMFQVDNVAFKSPQDKSKPGPANKTSFTWARPLRHTRDDPTTHIFDGKNITANGKTWQICDITDPVTHDVFHTDHIRKECDVYQWGWFHNGTLAKGRTIMKDKMRFLFAGEEGPEEDYRTIAQIPDELTQDNIQTTFMSGKIGPRVNQMSLEVRNIVKGGEMVKGRRIPWGPRSGRGRKKGKKSKDEDEDEQAEEEDEEEDIRVDGEPEDDGEGDFDRDDDAFDAERDLDPQLRPTRSRRKTAKAADDGQENDGDDLG